MSSEDKADSSCLVARAVPCALPSKAISPLESKNDELKKEEKNNSDTDALVSNFIKLNVSSSNSTSIKKPVRVADPADFITLQSLRSSALARKTNTTSKFGRDGANLFADLLSNDDEEKPIQKPVEKESPTEKPDEKVKKQESVEKVEKKEEKSENKEEKENADEAKESDLLSRGPVRAARSNVTYHPYSGAHPYPYPNSNESFDNACAPFGHPSSHYEYGNYREILSSSSTPDTVSSDLGYSSSSTSPHQQQSTSYTMQNNTVLPNKDDSELPDALSDFILKYSRSYRGPQHGHEYGSDENGMLSPKTGRPSSVDSHLCESPLSAVSAPESSSPSAPFGGITGPSTPLSEYRGCNKMGPLRTQLPSGQYTAYLGRQNGGQHTEQHSRPAKEVLRKLISTEETDDAWAWACKCNQQYPGALSYQDKDKDTLLHIVCTHMDLGKIFVLVEQMLKTDYSSHQKPFDMKNRNNETPLFLAVEKRHNEIVDYLLEVGADPNCQSTSKLDGPLHLAARLGMSDIVKTICSYNTTNLNAPNGKGLTPLLAAVQNHGVYEEEGGYIVDNLQTIQFLLKFGADPLIADATNGQTAMHFAIARMAPEIIDVFKDNLDEEIMSELVNKPDSNNETALVRVQGLTNTDESIRFKLCLSLIMCGANNSGSSTPSS